MVGSLNPATGNVTEGGHGGQIACVFFGAAQNGKRRRKQRKGGSCVSLVIHLARRGRVNALPPFARLER